MYTSTRSIQRRNTSNTYRTYVVRIHTRTCLMIPGLAACLLIELAIGLVRVFI